MNFFSFRGLPRDLLTRAEERQAKLEVAGHLAKVEAAEHLAKIETQKHRAKAAAQRLSPGKEKEAAQAFREAKVEPQAARLSKLAHQALLSAAAVAR